MTGLTFFYHLVKKLVSLSPAWLIRFRPFGVYQILLSKSDGTSLGMPYRRYESRDELNCQVRWVKDSTEAAMLGRVAAHENIASLNFTTRRAAAAWHEGEAIGCAWIATESFDERDLGLRFDLQPTDAWLFAAVVDPLRRQQGVYGQLMEFIIEELGRSEVRRILLGVSVGNEPSRRAHVRHGATPIGSIVAVRSLGFTACWRRGQVQILSALPIAWRRPVRLAVKLSIL